MKRDEAEAQARTQADEKRQQEFEAERRLAILRGETPPSPPPPELSSSESKTPRKREHDDDTTVRLSRGGGREHRKRKRFGEDDTDFEMRVARERTSAAASTNTIARRGTPAKRSEAPIVDSSGHISLFPDEVPRGDALGNQKNDEAEREAAEKRREFEDQYTMRFSNAAGRDGVGVGSSRPWYTSKEATEAREVAEAEKPGKDVWGNEDPKRKARDAARVAAGDPLATMKRGAAKVRDVERERRAENEEKAKELKQLRKEEKRREKRRRHHDVDDLEGFSLDARRSNDNDDDRKHESGHRDHRSRSRDCDGRDKHRHGRRSDHNDYHCHEGGDQRGHPRRDRAGEDMHSKRHSRRHLAKTDCY